MTVSLVLQSFSKKGCGRVWLSSIPPDSNGLVQEFFIETSYGVELLSMSDFWRLVVFIPLSWCLCGSIINAWKLLLELSDVSMQHMISENLLDARTLVPWFCIEWRLFGSHILLCGMINNTAATADGMERETFTSKMFFFSVLSNSLLGGRATSSTFFFWCSMFFPH